MNPNLQRGLQNLGGQIGRGAQQMGGMIQNGISRPLQTARGIEQAGLNGVSNIKNMIAQKMGVPQAKASMNADYVGAYPNYETEPPYFPMHGNTNVDDNEAFISPSSRTYATPEGYNYNFYGMLPYSPATTDPYGTQPNWDTNSTDSINVQRNKNRQAYTSKLDSNGDVAIHSDDLSRYTPQAGGGASDPQNPYYLPQDEKVAKSILNDFNKRVKPKYSNIKGVSYFQGAN